MKNRLGPKALAPLLGVALFISACGAGDDPPEPSAQPSAKSPSRPSDGAGKNIDLPTGDGNGGVGLEEIGQFESPLYVTQPDNGDDALYVIEQGGKVQRVAGGSTSTFLDISDRVKAGGEQGLLSIAFAPDYADSGLIYADYTDTDGNTRIAEYSVTGDSVDTSTERELLKIPQPFANHNGGLLVFGPDDLLYIGTGDGGSADDPQRNAQDNSTLLGKILRIDPRAKGGDPYRIPADNPFASGGGRGEIYAFGLRNPWRYSFDSASGDLSIGDVGQNSFEEVNLVRAGSGLGANFGWSAYEANERFNSDQSAQGDIKPVLAYPTADGNCSVTGGYVVRDPDLPSLYGRYLYGDFCAGQLRSFIAEPGRSASDDRPLGLEVGSLSSFGEDSQGRIYATSLDGSVFRLVASN